jgi:hypothetical protein
VFPVLILGNNFNPVGDLQVVFGRTNMPINSVSADGKQIKVGFPTGGFPETGPMDVAVRNLEPNSTKASEDVLVSGFTYENPVKPCFIATAAYGTPFAEHVAAFREFRDGVLLKTSVGTALVEAYYTVSPGVADVVARHPALAATVRLVLTPVAWLITWPALLAVPAVAGMTALGRRRMRRRL